jgi:BlaI family transcriptional regulator, penicillinase repressor
VQRNLHSAIDNAYKDMQNSLHMRRRSFTGGFFMSRFTAGELEVMRILWEHGELKPSEIQKLFPRPIKNAALRSYLTILVEKGHLVRRSKGKAFCYRPKTKRESTFRSALHDLVNTFCGGSTGALLCHLLAKEKLSPDELMDLQRMAQEQLKSSGSSKEIQS